jgi:hypothetical protein
MDSMLKKALYEAESRATLALPTFHIPFCRIEPKVPAASKKSNQDHVDGLSETKGVAKTKVMNE